MNIIQDAIAKYLEPIKSQINALKDYVDTKPPALTLQDIYPVGSVYFNGNDSRSPAELFGFGTWENFSKGRIPLGANGTYPVSSTGGEASVQLTLSQIPSHRHSYTYLSSSGSSWRSGQDTQVYSTNTGSTGNNYAHNNMPPYVAVMMWCRTA